MSRVPRVQLVSPSTEIRTAYPAYLRRHGMVVSVAEDIIEGFAKAVQHPPAVIVVDDTAPGVGEYLSRLREVTRTRDACRLLLVSSLPVDRDLAQAAAILLKPVWPDDLYGKVLRLVLDREDSKRRRDIDRSCWWG